MWNPPYKVSLTTKPNIISGEYISKPNKQKRVCVEYTEYRWRHRRRMYTEEKAKVVAAVSVTALIQFLAEQAILHQDDMKKRITSPG